jgi:TRAP-type C4-dicarboxylate transport system permease small subunit
MTTGLPEGNLGSIEPRPRIPSCGLEVKMRKLYQALCKAEVVLCGAGFVLLIAMVFLAAVLRFFRFSMAWNIDLALLLLAWTAFLGADIAWRSGQLVGVDLVVRNLPSGLQKIIQLIIFIIISCALILIIIFGSRLAWTERVRRFQSLPIPYSLVTMSLVTAATSMLLSTIQKIRRCIRSFGQENKPEAAG